jgi:hypothetical protein
MEIVDELDSLISNCLSIDDNLVIEDDAEVCIAETECYYFYRYGRECDMLIEDLVDNNF